MSTQQQNNFAGEMLAQPTPVPTSAEVLQWSPAQIHQTYAALQSMNLLARNITRRTVLGVGAALFTNAALHYIEKPILDDHYGVSSTTVMIPQPFVVPKDPRTAGLVSPGWGGTHGKSIVTTFREHDVYDPRFPLGFYHFSNTSVTSGDIGDCGLDYANALNLYEMDVHGISEGTMIALTGALKAGRHIRMVSSNDSPFDIDDAQHAWGARVIALANKLGLYHGGIMGKIAVCLVEEVDKHGMSKLATGWMQAIDSAWNGADPRMMVSQLAFMYDADLHGKRRQFGKLIDANTVAFILKTKRASTDPVVKDDQSTEKWVDWYEANRAQPVVIEVDAPGHANLYAGVRAGAQHMRRAINRPAA